MIAKGSWNTLSDDKQVDMFIGHLQDIGYDINANDQKESSTMRLFMKMAARIEALEKRLDN